MIKWYVRRERLLQFYYILEPIVSPFSKFYALGK